MKLFSFETILCMILLHSMKKIHNCAPSLSQWYLRNASKSLYRILTLTTKTYTEVLLKDGSALDGHSYSLYWVLTLTAKTYMNALLKDESAPDGHSYSLYRVLILTVRTYMEALLKNRINPDGHSYSLYQVLTLTARTCRRLSWKTEAHLTITHTAYIGSSLWQLGHTRRLSSKTEALLTLIHTSLYHVLTLTARTCTEALLKDESAPDGHSYNL